jgi:hypothetical protein
MYWYDWWKFYTIRADHLKPIQLNYEQTLRDIAAIEAFKKKVLNKKHLFTS